MKVYGLPLAALRETMDTLDLYPEEVARLRGGWAFSARPKGERYRVDPLGDDDDYFVVCQHGHEALIHALLERGAVVNTVLASYTPPMLTDGRWEQKQERVRAKHKQRFKSHQACHCELENAT